MSNPSFEPPKWAGEPVAGTCFHVIGKEKELEKVLKLDGKSYYTFGRNDEICDFTDSHSSVSRLHAAVVHHTDGRLYLIDLAARHGTFVNGKKIEKHKPTLITSGSKIKLGQAERSYVGKGCREGPSKEAGAGDGKKRAHESGHESGKDSSAKRAKDGGPETVRCLHLLVKHKNSRRPSSWKEEKITRSQDEAETMVVNFRKDIMAEAEKTGHMEKAFKDLATKESHCSSAHKGGDLGSFPRGKMQKTFEECAFGLKVGELSQIVYSDSGVHIILRLK